MLTTITKRSRQRGSVGGYLIAIILFGGLLTFMARLGPLYYDHSIMSNILDSMAMEGGIGNRTDNDIRAMIKQRFKLNNIRDFDIKQHVKFERTGRGTEIVMDYEVRMPMVHNIDMVASFDKRVVLRN
jgi:hypothetical protein